MWTTQKESESGVRQLCHISSFSPTLSTLLREGVGSRLVGARGHFGDTAAGETALIEPARASRDLIVRATLKFLIVLRTQSGVSAEAVEMITNPTSDTATPLMKTAYIHGL